MDYLIPEKIESDRLILRMFTHSDWKDIHPYYADEESVKYTMGRALTEGESWRTMAGMVGHWQLRGFGPYALELKESGKVIGVTGLWYPGDWPEPEIKWALVNTYQGKGYASEAARRVKQMARKYLPDTALISLIHPDNAPSIRLALAVGCTFEKSIEFRGGQYSIYRHH